MTLFEACILAHIVGDYLIQTDKEANQKAIRSFFNMPLLRHVIKYTICLTIPVILFQVSPLWVIWIFATHYVLDRRSFVIWWRKTIMRSSDEAIHNTFWLTVIVDQIFHLLAIGIMCLFQ